VKAVLFAFPHRVNRIQGGREVSRRSFYFYCPWRDGGADLLPLRIDDRKKKRGALAQIPQIIKATPGGK